MKVAEKHPGVNSNILADESQIDRLSGNAVLGKRIPVTIKIGGNNMNRPHILFKIRCGAMGARCSVLFQLQPISRTPYQTESFPVSAEASFSFPQHREYGSVSGSAHQHHRALLSSPYLESTVAGVPNLFQYKALCNQYSRAAHRDILENQVIDFPVDVIARGNVKDGFRFSMRASTCLFKIP
ncbi:MAG: hypothetical protein R2861_07280 [Desulfobacterales bacterium]